MNDFSRENRASGWWSTDCRRAVNGELIEVILEKQGKRERPPVEHLPERQQEAISMGLVMQPMIAQLFTDRTGIKVRELDIEMVHPREAWCKSHFDYIAEDNSALVECKNYNLAAMARFSDDGDPVRVPASDYAQCLHEATVAEQNTVYLAVLFGGQFFRTFRLEFSLQERIAHLQHYAGIWSHVVHGTLPEPQSTSDARLVWPRDNGNYVTASDRLERLLEEAKETREARKDLEKREEQYEAAIMLAMGNASEVRDVSGATLATWRTAKSSMRFDADLFKAAHPSLYKSFVVERPGSRRLIIK